MPGSMGSYDYVIVGAGSAGCVLANRLTADPAVSVLLVEAGGNDRYFWIPIPVGYLFTIGNPRTDWMYRTEPEEGLNGRTLGYARGKVMGGCTSINAMIYMRGQASDYDHWVSLGNRGWSYQDVLPIFQRMERYEGGSDKYRGRNGLLRVNDTPRNKVPLLEKIIEAAARIGLPFNPDQNRTTATAGSSGQTTEATPGAVRIARRPALTHPELQGIITDCN